MTQPATAALPLWTQERASRPDRARIRARIAGMHCSLCTGTIEKALGKHAGVDKVSVSLTHEQALVEYDPVRVQPQDLLLTLRQMGYTNAISLDGGWKALKDSGIPLELPK